jgi:hypothetical protein
MVRRQLVLGKLHVNEQLKETLDLLGQHDCQGLSVCARPRLRQMPRVSQARSRFDEVHWRTATLPAGEYTITMDSLNKCDARPARELRPVAWDGFGLPRLREQIVAES